MFLSADPSTISELFSRDPGLPTGAAAPSPTHQDDGDESDDDVEGDDEDHIAVEHDIIEERQLQTFSAINNGLFSEDEILTLLLNPRKTGSWLDTRPLQTMWCGTQYYPQNSPILHIWHNK